MGTDTKDVTLLKDDPNTVSFQDRGDGYSATNAILISETIKPDLIVTKTDPSRTIFVNNSGIILTILLILIIIGGVVFYRIRKKKSAK